MAGSGQIRPNSGHFSQIQLASDQGWIPASFSWNIVRQHSATVAECRRQYSSGRMLPYSCAAWIPTTNHCQILTIKYQTCVQG
jgi:hypothetical protein